MTSVRQICGLLSSDNHVAKKTRTYRMIPKLIGILLDVELATLTAFEAQTTDPVRLIILLASWYSTNGNERIRWHSLGILLSVF